MNPLLSQKKKKERQIIDQFRQVFPDFPKGKLVSAESPDFILRISIQQAIGIELVSISYGKGAGSSVPEVIRDAILSKEEKLPLYRKKRLDFYWLLLHDSNSWQFPLHNTDSSIEDLEVHSDFHRIFLLLLEENNIIVIK